MLTVSQLVTVLSEMVDCYGSDEKFNAWALSISRNNKFQADIHDWESACKFGEHHQNKDMKEQFISLCGKIKEKGAEFDGKLNGAKNYLDTVDNANEDWYKCKIAIKLIINKVISYNFTSIVRNINHSNRSVVAEHKNQSSVLSQQKILELEQRIKTLEDTVRSLETALKNKVEATSDNSHRQVRAALFSRNA